MKFGSGYTVLRNDVCSISFSSTFHVISLKFGLLFGQCGRYMNSKENLRRKVSVNYPETAVRPTVGQTDKRPFAEINMTGGRGVKLSCYERKIILRTITKFSESLI